MAFLYRECYRSTTGWVVEPKDCLCNGQALSLAGLPRLEDGGEGLFHPRLGKCFALDNHHLHTPGKVW